MLLSSPTKDPIKVQSVILLMLIEVNKKYEGIWEKLKSLRSVQEGTADPVPNTKLLVWILVFFTKVFF